MFAKLFGIGRITVFIVAGALAFAVGLAAQTAPQDAKPTPAASQETTDRSAPVSGEVASLPGDRTVVDPVTGQPAGDRPARQGPAPVDPKLVLPGPSDKSLPGPTADGSVGPDGRPIGKGAQSSPGGPVVVDRATERRGPGATAGDTPTVRPLAPGAAGTPGPRAGMAAPSPAAQPGRRNDRGPVPNQPAAAQQGLRVFIDPATGEIVDPTAGQVAELERERQLVEGPAVSTEVVERPSLLGGGGMLVDVPTSLYPTLEVTIGADGKLSYRESQGPGEAVATSGSGAGQSAGVVADERRGPSGNQGIELPPPPNVTVTIANNDGAGEGFNDPTAVAPVFGNPGTTRGAQRLNAFRAAAEYWGAILKSTVPIVVNAQMNPQTCGPTSGTLGSAGPTTMHRDFTNAPVANTWYVQAVASSLLGTDIDPTTNDINATFNSDVDNAFCLGTTDWWYGIGAPAPPLTIDFYAVVQHEIGHGIGVLSLASLSTGEKLSGRDDAYMRWLYDWTTAEGWPSMTNAERVASSTRPGQVSFWGPNATEAARGFVTSGLNNTYPTIFTPNPVQLGSSVSHWNTAITPNELMEPSLTPPPGPYQFLTSGLLQDVGWNLLSNGVFDFGASGTWTWNSTDGWVQPTSANPIDLEPWNGNFIGTYENGTWLRNGTTGGWTQLTDAVPQSTKACGNNLLWEWAAGTWRWNATTGWQQLTGSNPDSIECFGGNMVWESALGTWIYDFSTGWSQITAVNPTGMLPCGSNLVWWWGSGTWYWNAATGWHSITGSVPENVECHRGMIVWESGAGTWLYNFSTGWTSITSANPDQILSWGPSLVWESVAFGTWIYDQAGNWTQITGANPTVKLATLGAFLLWVYDSGTWLWGGGGGGVEWQSLTGAVPTKVVTTGAVK